MAENLTKAIDSKEVGLSSAVSENIISETTVSRLFGLRLTFNVERIFIENINAHKRLRRRKQFIKNNVIISLKLD